MRKKERQERTKFKNLNNKSEKYPGNNKRCVNAHLQLTHAFTYLRGVKGLVGPNLDPLGILVDMEKGNKESGTVALRDQLKRKIYS